MNDCDNNLISKILISYRELGEKKFFKQLIKDIQIDKKLYMLYFKKRFIPICTLPKLRIIFISKHGFVSFCYNFFTFLYSKNIFINISCKNLISIAKFVIYHEVGHILDTTIKENKLEYNQIVKTFIERLIEYDIDINSKDLHKVNLPPQVEECVIGIKKNLIERESKAWKIAYDMIVFEDKNEELIFNNMREYALATYNFGNIKNIINENNIDLFVKYKKAI
ncbi:hypothetical protein [Paraclostridium sordellii]|uniref:hypothetical protein n=1 Tax=Paraclostridium sordellii TaxID=1505 RepID=UPI0005E0A5B2|nr:hypothetical protein [Paeniclostridium sordellii]MCQ4695889.1 hypothetical protein [Paeniclostridium sordellii]MDU6480931.1 hypothetical protein [Paeniclostridium sordellii]CEN82505.1 Uncharacterised protein [[Clostridium] sordellii] [Paeniclostridium sordellii]CEO07496.1 Uncharacterised protein [[Clostridium] sordellii] [Paeniclostridium sordellii]CEO22158.1 Uncharacterised protein [[Clostridium] sordellii] [Paeniclostridium sordellii]